jgi:hypothetical protein
MRGHDTYPRPLFHLNPDRRDSGFSRQDLVVTSGFSRQTGLVLWENRAC